MTFKYGESDTHSEEVFFSQKFERFGVLLVENIFDKKYIFGEYEDYDSVSPGRIVMGKVKFRF